MGQGRKAVRLAREIGKKVPDGELIIDFNCDLIKLRKNSESINPFCKPVGTVISNNPIKTLEDLNNELKKY